MKSSKTLSHFKNLIFLCIAANSIGCGVVIRKATELSGYSTIDFLAGAYGLGGSIDGQGAAAKFNYPQGITSDGTYLYVVDVNNNLIRKINIATRVVTTLAASAGLNYPQGITTDGTNLYVTDASNFVIRKIVISTGVVSTLAGTIGASGAADGVGGAASFAWPNAIVEASGFLYVVDADNHKIRKIDTSDGTVTTFVGDGTAATLDGVGVAAQVYLNKGGGGLATDGTYLYLVEQGGVRQIEISSATVSTLWANSCGRPGCANNGRAWVATDGVDLFFLNTEGGSVRKINISSGVVTPIAGVVDVYDFSDGVGTDATFNFPWGYGGGIVLVGSNLFVSDSGNNVIRKVVISTNTVSTFAGPQPPNTSYGYANGLSALARFGRPVAITSDGTSVFVADTNNEVIRKINISSGTVTTLAGTPGVAGSVDGTGQAARFSFAYGRASLTNDGTNLYLTDYNNFTVRQINISTGVVTTLAGTVGVSGVTDGVGTAASFAFIYSCAGIVYDGSGNLYVTDGAGLRKIVISTGTVSTVTAAHGDSIGAIETDGTYIYVPAGLRVNRIHIGTGVATTLAGSGAYGFVDAVGGAAKFDWAFGAALIGTDLFVTDGTNQAIRKVDTTTGAVTTLAGGNWGSSDGIGRAAGFMLYDWSYGAGGEIVTDGTYLYVADTLNNSVRKIDPSTGAVTTLAGLAPFNPIGTANGALADAKFNYPSGLATDGTNLFIADNWNSVVRQVNVSSGVVSLLAGSGQWDAVDGVGANAVFNGPSGLVADATNVYVVDSGNNTIRKVEISSGTVTTFAGTAGVTGSADGVGAAASFNMDWAGGITMLGNNLYVTDHTNNTIRKIEISSATVSTVSGTAGVTGSTDATGAAASFNMPVAITNDGTNLYVLDAGNYTIRKIELSTGAVSTLAGTVGTTGSTDGIGSAASFNFNLWAGGMTSDGTNLYVTDTNNSTVRKIVIATGTVTTLAGVASEGDDIDGDLIGEARLNQPISILYTPLGLVLSESTSLRFIH